MKELTDLADLVRNIWSPSRKWRLNDGLIEFSIETACGDAWFPVWNAPSHVEELVNTWQMLSGSK